MREGLLIADKYRILRPLGEGGMGSVWLAQNTFTEREFAIKLLHTGAATDSLMLQRFFQEAKVSGRIRHPSMLEIFDAGTAPELDGAPYLVMELLDGASLDAVIQSIGRLPERLTLQILAAIARALDLAHQKGIIHRDLKPANIFLHKVGTGAIVPKVLDFGISKVATMNLPNVASGLTDTGAVLGSPMYMSPEQAGGDKSIDGRSDVHALGVVMWECLVGAPPFLQETYNNLVVEIMTGERPKLASVMPGIAPELAAIVERAIARKRDERYASAALFADAIEARLAALEPGTSLDSRTAASELFARMAIGHQATHPPSALQASTAGGVAVSVPTGNAPAARRVFDSFAETAAAAPPATSSTGTQVSAHHVPPAVATTTPTPMSAPVKPGLPRYVLPAAGGILLVGVAAAFAFRGSPSATGASVPPSSPSTVPSAVAETSTASSGTSLPVVAPPPSTPPSAPVTSASAPPAEATSAPKVAPTAAGSGAKPAAKPAASGSPTARPTKRRTDDLNNSGL